ncbi:LysR family transcriptional regulator [Rummeliibacillus pycnus]|uniref:LysR family transcriptional regulator n=1 Tax=Rummeliibacillus pycnus TaxID=101070 RepID=UPI003D2BF6AE
MDLQQLKYFQTVAKTEHMTHAAEKLNISQPALSKSIAQLEEEVGAPLFDRMGRSIKLNRFGELFLKGTMPINKLYEDVKQEIADLITPDYGVISIGFTHTVGMQLIPRLVRMFRRKYPNVQFEFTQNNSLHLLQQLEAGEFDLCLIPYVETDIPIKWVELWREELFVMVPKDHRLANREQIYLSEIGKDPFVSLKEGNSLRQVNDQLLEQANISPEVVFEGEEFHTLAGFVEAGLGVALLPNIRGLNEYHLSKIRVSEPICQRKLGIAYIKKRYMSQATQTFRDFVIGDFQ